MQHSAEYLHAILPHRRPYLLVRSKATDKGLDVVRKPEALLVGRSVRQSDGLTERPPALGYVLNVRNGVGDGHVRAAHGVQHIGYFDVAIVQRVSNQGDAHRMLFL